MECLILDGRTEADRTWIRKESGLDGAAADLVSAEPARSGRSQLRSAIVLNLVRPGDANAEALIGVSMLIEANRLLAVCFGATDLVESALARYSGQEGGGISRLLPAIVAALVRPLETEISRIADTIDDLEDKAMEEGESGEEGLYDSVVRVARQVLALRRYLIPMRDELSFLALDPEELPGTAEPRYLRRAADYPGRLVGALDSSHHRVTLVLDQLRKRDDGRMARSMHKLTIVGTVFLPLSFVTGMLGMNVAGVPGEHDPLSFWLVCALLLLVALAALALIQWRKWL